MGTMQLDDFKKIIDQAHNNVQFITLASNLTISFKKLF